MVLYDLIPIQPHGNAKVHGAGKYAEIIFRRMVEKGVEFSAFYNSKKFIAPEILQLAHEKCLGVYDVSKMNINEIIKKVDNATIFSLLPSPEYTICKTVGTIHDVREIYTPNDFYQFKYSWNFNALRLYVFRKLFPEKFRQHRLKQLLPLWSSSNFFPATITYFTKFTTFSLYSKEKILHMPIFYTPTEMGVTDVDVSDDGYIFMVSGNRWIKNCLRAIIALDTLFSKGLMCGYKVIITGLDSFSSFRYKIKNKDRFVNKGYVDENELSLLYSHCSCFLFPSLYEGFGMPLVEAMKYGKPVLASCLSSIPEVCENAAVFFDPYSIDDIASKLLMLINDKQLFDDYSRKSRERYDVISKRQFDDIDNYINYALSVNNK